MKERERVLELVQKGILSTEEALVLLENMATEKAEKITQTEASNIKTTPAAPKAADSKQSAFEDSLPEVEEDLEAAQAKLAEQEEKDRKRLEEILDELATQANFTSAELDEVNAQLKEAQAELKSIEEDLLVFDTKEELDEEINLDDRDLLCERKIEFEKTIAELKNQKEQLEEKLKNIRREQKEGKTNSWTDKFEIPDDWKDTATDTLNQVGEKMGEAGSQLGRFLKKTINTVVESVNDNVDWKDVNFKVPGIATTKFEHEFFYPQTQASIIDIKVANGEIELKKWDQEDVKVSASIKLYGKMDAATPLEAFLERSEIEIDDEKILFQVPNKRVRADLVFYLPARLYDHVSVKMLNGDMLISEIELNDFYGKSTNGDLEFKNIVATMLEVESVNGDVELIDSKVVDFLADNVNGDFALKSDVQNIHIKGVNGDVKVTSKNPDLRKVDVKLVHGTIKVAVPKEVGLEGTAQVSMGSVKNRLSDYEVIREKKDKMNQYLQFRRVQEHVAQIELNTTTGSIYLKDTDQ